MCSQQYKSGAKTAAIKVEKSDGYYFKSRLKLPDAKLLFRGQKDDPKNRTDLSKKYNITAKKKFENIAENITEPGGENADKMTWIFTVKYLAGEFRLKAANRLFVVRT